MIERERMNKNKQTHKQKATTTKIEYWLFTYKLSF